MKEPEYICSRPSVTCSERDGEEGCHGGKNAMYCPFREDHPLDPCNDDDYDLIEQGWDDLRGEESDDEEEVTT